MTIQIKGIDTKPERDPYINIEGVVSRTFLKLDPRDSTAWVTQEYQDNATPADEWHGLVLTWHVNSHPSDSAMRQWIEDSMAQLEAVCAGYEAYWNGSSHKGGIITPEARAASEAIQQQFDADEGPENFYEVWTVERWLEESLSEITADMTDEQLEAMASNWEPGEGTVVLGDIAEYVIQHRDNLKWEQEY